MRQKRAFSLIEVLLVMGIIAVVTAMGFSISKNGMEKAYNQFWYTGYEALYNVTIDAIQNDKFHPNRIIDNSSASDELTNYAKHLAKMVNAEYKANCTGSNSTMPNLAMNNRCRTVTAPNGIIYEIWYNVDDVLNKFFRIDMTIPALKQRRAFANKTRFMYYYNPDQTRIPYSQGIIYPANFAGTGIPYMNLHDRIDILPYYLSDGTDNTTTTRTFYSFREAFCRATVGLTLPIPEEPQFFTGYQHGSDSSVSILCTGIPVDTNQQGDLIYPINPRKAF